MANETLQDIEKEQTAVREQEQQAYDAAAERRDTGIANAHQEIDKLYKENMAAREPEPFDYRTIKPPHHELSRDFMLKGAILMGVALVGAAYMRQGSTVAMAGLTAGLQALQAGDKMRYDEEMKRYELTIKMMGQEHDRRMKQYNSIIKNNNMSIQQKEHEIRLLQATYGEDANRIKQTYSEHLKDLDRQAAMIRKMHSTIVIKNNTRDTRTSPQKEYDRIARENGPAWKKEHPYEQWLKTDWPKLQQDIHKKQGGINASALLSAPSATGDSGIKAVRIK